jgi:MFS superfamily sulfate permease-like transporter
VFLVGRSFQCDAPVGDLGHDRSAVAVQTNVVAKHHYQVDINQESVARGMANAGAGLFQGMPVSTSLSASSLNEHSGARRR